MELIERKAEKVTLNISVNEEEMKLIHNALTVFSSDIALSAETYNKVKQMCETTKELLNQYN